MQQYLDLLKKIIDDGHDRDDRTGTGTRSIFGYQMRFDLEHSFPLLTTKKVHLRSIIYELLWFINGDTNIKYLNDNKVKIWDEWADKNGDLGPVYGAQWRSWPRSDKQEINIDQLSELMFNLTNTPYSRRHIISAWNVEMIDKMALPPCHCLFQFFVHDGKLSCQLYQRSADVFLGVPFNIASYALLTMMIAKSLGLIAHEFVHTFGDAHLYKNHLKQAKEQLNRDVRNPPKLLINDNQKSIFDYEYSDFELVDYNPHPHIKAPISV